MVQFEFDVWLPCSPEGLFDFLLRPANVARISDPRAGLKIVSGPEAVDVGSRVSFQVQTFGLVQTIEHEILVADRPERIVERQLRGPMRAWEHEHLLQPVRDGVRMIDRIEFLLPGGVLGMLLKESQVLDTLDAGFGHREAELRRLISAGVLQ
jgi:ligand-binding SRPBCC domain-containing protein